MILCTMLILIDGEYRYLVTTDAEHFSRTHSKSRENVCLFIYKLSNMKRKP